MRHEKNEPQQFIAINTYDIDLQAFERNEGG